MENEFNDELENIRNEAEARADWELEMEFSMRKAFHMIEMMGWPGWNSLTQISHSSKVTILNNMLKWHEEREEYERCSFIQEGLRLLQLTEGC
jgi:hypothetical protein